MQSPKKKKWNIEREVNVYRVIPEVIATSYTSPCMRNGTECCRNNDHSHLRGVFWKIKTFVRENALRYLLLKVTLTLTSTLPTSTSIPNPTHLNLVLPFGALGMNLTTMKHGSAFERSQLATSFSNVKHNGPPRTTKFKQI